MKYNEDILKGICKDLRTEFENRIVCLLYYGSNAYNREIKKNSDYDFCLVLDKRRTSDFLGIRKILKQIPKVELTLHYLENLEKDGWENFQSDNHGVFYLFHFASAKVLIGDNIFLRKLHLVQSTEYIQSLRRQIIEYFWRLDNVIFTLPDDELLKSDIFRKYSIRIMQDILVSRGDISFSEINTITYIDFFNKFVKNKEYIRNQTKDLLYVLINNNLSSVNELIALKECLYEDFKNCFN